MVSRTLITIALVALASPVQAQIMRGRIVGATTGEQLRGAAVSLLDDRGREIAHSVTDTTGAFALRPARSGFYRLKVDLIGYSPVESALLELKWRESVHLAVRMSTQPIALAPIVVTARERGRGTLDDFERRRQRHATGYFITREDLERHTFMSVSTYLWTVPGVIVQGNSMLGHTITLPGTIHRCPANVFLNGMRVRGASIDDIMIPDWVGGIEVYPRGSTVPPEYQTAGDNCGAVLFWTNDPPGGIRWNVTKLVAAAAFALGAVLVTR